MEELEKTQEQLDREALQARFDALPDLRACMTKAGNNTPNAKLMVYNAVNDNDIALVESLEVYVEEVEDELENEKIDELRRKEYGSVVEQLDEMYHNITKWRSRIKKIKEKHVKRKVRRRK